MQRLEAQVQALSERIAELNLTQASYRAQVETLQSRCAAGADPVLLASLGRSRLLDPHLSDIGSTPTSELT